MALEIDKIKRLLENIEVISNTIFIVVAVCTGMMVAHKFINSRDKKEAVHYAIWWVVGIFFFFSIQSIVTELKPEGHKTKLSTLFQGQE